VETALYLLVQEDAETFIAHGTPALLAGAADGQAAMCRTDGTSAAAAVSSWSGMPGATLATRFDLLKDALPILAWTALHPAFAPGGGTLTITAIRAPEVGRGRTTPMALRSRH